jgi:heparanase 1
MPIARLHWVVLTASLLCLSTASHAEAKSAVVVSDIHVATAQSVSKTDDVWACANLGWYPPDKCNYGMCPWGQSGVLNIDFNQTMLHHAVAAFDGAFHLRLGGSLSDFVLYNVSLKDAASCVPFSAATNATRLGYDYFTGCMSLKRWNEILDFAMLTNISIVFGVSALHGRQQPPPCPQGTNCPAPNRPSCCFGPWLGDWQSDNLMELLDYTLASGYRNIYALEFGNELAGQYGIQAKFSPEQYSADFSRFVDAVGSAYAHHSESPPLTLVPGNSWDADWYSQFLKLLDGSHRPGIVSHHLYSLGGGFDPASGDRALDPAHLNLIATLADNVTHTLAPFQPPAPAVGFSVWVGEAGGAYNSGRDGVTNTFWSSFWCAAQPAPNRAPKLARVAARVTRQQVYRSDGFLCTARPWQVLPPDVGWGKLRPAQHLNSAAAARLLHSAAVVPYHGPVGSGRGIRRFQP